MTPIPRTFFLTGLGRSGTAFLAAALNSPEDYRVVHEWKIPRTPFRDGRLSHFPLWRFYLARHPLAGLRPGYGEVNSHLRRTLSATSAGPEARIEKRGVILRDPRDAIASGMNRNARTDDDFERLCDETLRDFAFLQSLLRHPTLHYERFEFRRFTTDPDYVRQIAAWAGIRNLDVPDDLVARKVNPNMTNTFPRWKAWSGAQQDAFRQSAIRYEVMDAVEALAEPVS